MIEIKKLFDITHDEALQHINKAQDKQVKTQNLQTNSSHDALMERDKVYIKNCKLIKNKFEPLYTGPFIISHRNVGSGNYVLKDLNGLRLENSFPRWKLKASENYKDIKIISPNTTSSTNSNGVKVAIQIYHKRNSYT